MHETTRNDHVTYSRIAKSAIIKDNRERKHKEMAKTRGRNKKGTITKEFYSKRRKQTGSESKLKPKCNNNCDRPWKCAILLASIKNCGKCGVPVQTRHINSRPSDAAVRKDKERERSCEERCAECRQLANELK